MNKFVQRNCPLSEWIYEFVENTIVYYIFQSLFQKKLYFDTKIGFLNENSKIECKVIALSMINFVLPRIHEKEYSRIPFNIYHDSPSNAWFCKKYVFAPNPWIRLTEYYSYFLFIILLPWILRLTQFFVQFHKRDYQDFLQIFSIQIICISFFLLNFGENVSSLKKGEWPWYDKNIISCKNNTVA